MDADGWIDRRRILFFAPSASFAVHSPVNRVIYLWRRVTVKGQRFWWVLGGLAALALALAMGGVAGGGLVYALTRSESRLPLATAQGRDPGYGLVVAAVEPEGPAYDAGVVRGDILLEVDGERIENRADLIGSLAALEPGERIELLVQHGDEQRTLSVTPDERAGRAYLGLTPCGGPIDGPTLRWFQPGELSPGALLVGVTEESPADEAGLQAGDVITAVDGDPVDAETDLADRIAAYRPGDTVSLTVERPGEEPREVTVELGSQPEDEDAPYLGVRYRPTPHPGMMGREGRPFEQFRDLPFELPFSLPHGNLAGVVVQHIVEDSPAQAAGLEAGDVITTLDGEAVESAQALTESIAAHAPGDEVTLTVVRLSSGDERQVVVTLAEHPDQDGKAYLGVYLGGYFRLPHTEEDGRALQRWFFDPRSDEGGMPRGFEFRWPWQSPDDNFLDDDVGSL
jgi:S1-C subfamily serine protease